MKIRNALAHVSVAAALSIGLTQGNAAPLLYIGDNGGILGTVDVATGTPTVIGNMGVVMTDIAFDPAGNLWGIDFQRLYQINKNTGASTLVGELGLCCVNSLTFGADGTLYAGGLSAGADMVKINTGTGAATIMGPIGIGDGSSGDLAFHNGVLYLSVDTGPTDSLVSINTTTGAGTLIGDMGVDVMYGLANGDDNVLYGTAGTSIYSIDAATGAATFVNSWGGGRLEGANGAAFFQEAGATVPEPGVLVLLGLGLAGLAAVRRK